ncbi:MAG: hypothetical protein V1664_03475 [Candidatus Uhrbacteria bacterium]
MFREIGSGFTDFFKSLGEKRNLSTAIAAAVSLSACAERATWSTEQLTAFKSENTDAEILTEGTAASMANTIQKFSGLVKEGKDPTIDLRDQTKIGAFSQDSTLVGQDGHPFLYELSARLLDDNAVLFTDYDPVTTKLTGGRTWETVHQTLCFLKTDPKTGLESLVIKRDISGLGKDDISKDQGISFIELQIDRETDVITYFDIARTPGIDDGFELKLDDNGKLKEKTFGNYVPLAGKHTAETGAEYLKQLAEVLEISPESK